MPNFNNGARGRKPPIIASEPTDRRGIAAFVDQEIRARSLRASIFHDSIINDSSWPLVLHLFNAHLNDRKMRTKELYVESALPQTTVLRYLDHLEKCEVVRRDDDKSDSRVTLVSLTDSAAHWLAEYYSQIIEAERDLEERGEGILSLPNGAIFQR
jgi:DNA-binding MarR family transcriptional regulator